MRDKEAFHNILPEYGRRRLLMFADSIRELASTFNEADKPEEVAIDLPEQTLPQSAGGPADRNNPPQTAINPKTKLYSLKAGINSPMPDQYLPKPGINPSVPNQYSSKPEINSSASNQFPSKTAETKLPDPVHRKDLLWQRRMQENKGIMACHLQEMAQLMSRVAEEARRYTPMGERRYKQIAHALKEVNIQVKDICLLENKAGHTELSLVLRSSKAGNAITVEEIGDVIAVLINKRMTPSVNNPFFISQEWQAFYYVEAARFHVLTGVAKAVKETEKISGDNYAIFETEPGSLTVVLSDGMGSGSKACRDSSMIVELMEKFLGAGFQREIAVQMINSVLLAGPEAGNLSTLDLCSIDLHNGYCEIVKIGSASSYIKREHLVDRISAGNLPLGIFNRPDMEIVKRRLIDGDYIIMVSDGVLDALSQGIGEDMMGELVGGTELKNPNEIANALLNFCIHQSKGKIRDDMTVLVIGIWEKDTC